MSLRIAIAGKGGTGKTTIAGLLCRSLVARGIKPVLAVDADPNSCLPEKLGLRVEWTIGDLREFMRVKPELKPASLSKSEWLNQLVNEAIVESTGLDMLVMGRQEGPDCYCFVNHLLRDFLDRMGNQYPAVVIDNEAGLEHLSRRTDGSVEVMLVACLPTISGARTAVRIMELVKSLKLKIGHCFLVLNQSNGRIEPAVAAEFQRAGLETLGAIPADPQVAECEAVGRSLAQLAADAPAAAAVDDLVMKLLERRKA